MKLLVFLLQYYYTTMNNFVQEAVGTPPSNMMYGNLSLPVFLIS